VCPLVLGDRDSLLEFELWDFSSAFSCNPMKCRISEVRNIPPHVGLLFWTTEIHFGSLVFGSSGDIPFLPVANINSSC
jgi:hypothetical protein